ASGNSGYAANTDQSYKPTSTDGKGENATSSDSTSESTAKPSKASTSPSKSTSKPSSKPSSEG
ncbi:MAG: hypothetical protein VX426_05810, partial [Chloroflexota bacterium]|nr:hypothetical protein [Chloroflexota bacterium]